jgi:TPR repeat protein
MKKAFFAVGLMLAGAAGCVRVDDLPSLVPPPDGTDPAERPRGDERSYRGAQLATACRDGTVPRERAGACLILAGYFEEGVFGLPQDPARAAVLWESAVDILQASCEVGEVTDCTRAASAIGMRLHGGGDAASEEAAGWMVQYAEDGCRGGDVTGCALLGLIHERGRGVARDAERAAAYYDQACDGGHRQSCLLLASRAEGRSAVLAYERACDAGSGFGCATAAQHHRRGAFVEPSLEKAAELFSRGCTIGNLAACVMGAEMYSNVDVSPQENRRARLMAGAGCTDGIADGCLVLGELLERDKKRYEASEAYRMACRLGAKKGCDAVRRLPAQPAVEHWYEEGD